MAPRTANTQKQMVTGKEYQEGLNGGVHLSVVG